MAQIGFHGPDAPAEADLYRCVHCGLCLSACPTYMQLGVETESPRGRLALMKAVTEGRVPVTDRIVSHWEMCLQCRACEAVCPSGVPYGWIMENTRSQVLQQGKRSEAMQAVSRWFLRAAFRAAKGGPLDRGLTAVARPTGPVGSPVAPHGQPFFRSLPPGAPGLGRGPVEGRIAFRVCDAPGSRRYYGGRRQSA